MSGWIKLHRQIQECFLWRIKEPFDKRSAWIDLLLLMEHQNKNLMIDGKIETIKRGSYMLSIEKLCDRWMWSRNKVKRYLDVLEREHMIVTRRTNKGTLVSVVNYCVYQNQDKQGEPPHEPPHEPPLEPTDEPSLELAHEPPHEPPLEPTDEPSLELALEPPHEPQIKNIRNKEDKNIYIVSNDTICQTQDVRRVVDKWNELEKYGIASIKKLTSSSNRYRMLNARIKQFSLDDVLTAIENIKDSSFLQGKSDSRRPWIITFDWFVKPNNFPKVLEGQYSDKKDGQNRSDQKSVTDTQLEQLAERQKQSVPILSDEEINKMFGE